MAKGKGKGKKGKNDSAKDRSAGKKPISEKKRVEIDRKIHEAFRIFDISGNKTCQTNEVGTILRYLNIFPSEEKLKEWLKLMEEEEPTGYIVYDKFYQIAFTLLVEDAQPAFEGNPFPLPPLPKLPIRSSSNPNDLNTTPTLDSLQAAEQLQNPLDPSQPIQIKTSFFFKGLNEDMLMRAFKTLDREGRGFLTSQQLQLLLTSEGDPLLKEEMDDMLLACVDENENKIYFDDYVNIIANMM